MNKKKIIVIAVLTLLLGGGGFRIYQHKMMENVYSGTVEATTIDLSSQVSSRVEDYLAKEGDEIEEGKLVVRLQCEDIKISHTQAERDYLRSQKLRKEGSVSQENFEHALSRYEDLKVKKNWCEITAPHRGTILYTFKEKGELVLPGQKLLSLADLSDLWSYIYISAPLMAKVHLGQELEAFLPQLDQKITVKVIHINAQAEFTPKNVQTREERERLVYGIKVSFPNTEKKIYPGMNLEVKLHE